MTSLITMAVYDTEDNGRTWMTKKTLLSLMSTVNFDYHQLMIADNGSCEATHELYETYRGIITDVEYIGKNIGTAAALNRLWRRRTPEHRCVVKIDNDVMIWAYGWLELMEKAFDRDWSLGIAGLKRKDLQEFPGHHDPFYRSALEMMDHRPGEPWVVLEFVNHVMGTCQAYRRGLLDKIGYLYQPGLYGFDDALAAVRCKQAGYRLAFIPHIEIDHIDRGGTNYTIWKSQEAGRLMGTYERLVDDYKSGRRSVYYDGGFDV